jgi:hypothetical protein
MRKDTTMRFRLFRRATGKFYCEDSTTGKQLSLYTGDRTQAQRLVHAKNEAVTKTLSTAVQPVGAGHNY